jgi:hypothetical protein
MYPVSFRAINKMVRNPENPTLGYLFDVFIVRFCLVIRIFSEFCFVF